MKIWIDAKEPAPNDTYTHHALNNDEAKSLIKECEKNGEVIRGINVDDNGIGLMKWMINRHTRYPILYHVEDESIRLQIQELFEANWLL